MSDLNDPRVFFAAERTLLAWNRTALSLMAFGFVIERFGLFLELVGKDEIRVFQRHVSLLIGVTFILLGAFLAGYSALQHRRFIRTLRAVEVPDRYNPTVGVIVNALIAFLGVMLALYILPGFF